MTRHPFRALTLSFLSVKFAVLFSVSISLVLSGCGGGGGGGGSPPPVDPVLSSFTVTPEFGTPADGASTVAVDLVLADANGNPLPGRRIQLEVTGFLNTVVQPPLTSGAGAASGSLLSQVGEKKAITAVVDPGPNEVRLGPVTAEFLRILPNWRFVRAGGSDAADGRTPLSAWRTLAHAIAQVGPGQVVFVGAGTYADPLLITTVATADAPLVIRGDRTGEFTGDAGEVLLDAGAAASGIELRGAANVTLRGLSIRGSDSGTGHGGAVYASGATSCAILDCRLYENQRGVELENTAGTRLEGNRISASTGDGLWITGTAGTRVLDNLIYANGGDGIELAAPSSDLRIELNTFYRNAGDQIREPVAGGTGWIADNVFAEGTGKGLALSAGSSLGTSNNLSWLQAGNTPASTITADPLLVDPFGPDGILGGIGAEDDDFRVASTSPALDAGSLEARAVELALGGSLAALGTRTDGLLDGQSPDLALANLGFHYPVPTDPSGSLGAQGGRAAFARALDARLWMRAWNRSNGEWAATANPLDLGADVRWLVQRVTPGPKPEELVAVLAETGAGTLLFVRAWDGRRWSDDSPAVLSTDIPLANADERGFDLEYEALSGDALLVRVDGKQNVLAQTLVDGAWSTAVPVFVPALATGTLLWTELVPRAGTDEVALVALDDQQKLVAAVWNGSAWTQPILLATQVNALHRFKAFDAAWEGVSGDLLVAWGYSEFSEETRFATLERLTGTWRTGQFVSTDALGKYLALSSDPTSNQIVAIFGEGTADDDVGVSVWGGTYWHDTAELTLTGIAQSRAMEVGWLGTSGKAFALYRDQAQTGAFQWALLNSGGWKRQPEVFLAGVGKLVQAETRIRPGTNRVLMLLLDDAGKLWAVEHDGTAWVLRNGGAPLATGLDAATRGRNFDFDLRLQ